MKGRARTPRMYSRMRDVRGTWRSTFSLRAGYSKPSSLLSKASSKVEDCYGELVISESTKSLSFESLNCPALREIRCKDFRGYGNGLVPARPGGEPLDYRHPLQPEERQQLCAFRGVGRDGPGPFFQLPEQCVVSWGCKSNELRASASMTLGELEDLADRTGFIQWW